jgi:hypothetical protein
MGVKQSFNGNNLRFFEVRQKRRLSERTNREFASAVCLTPFKADYNQTSTTIQTATIRLAWSAGYFPATMNPLICTAAAYSSHRHSVVLMAAICSTTDRLQLSRQALQCDLSAAKLSSLCVTNLPICHPPTQITKRRNRIRQQKSRQFDLSFWMSMSSHTS